jgi:hypothetical protein
MDAPSDLRPVYLRELARLLPELQSRALAACTWAVGAFALVLALALTLLLEPQLRPGGALPQKPALLLLPAALLLGQLIVSLLSRPRPSAELLASGLAQRIAGGLLLHDPIFDYAAPGELARLPGRDPADFRGQLRRLCENLRWYLAPPRRPVNATRTMAAALLGFFAVGSLAALLLMSPFHGALIAALGACAACVLGLQGVRHAQQLAQYLAAAWEGAPPEPASANPGVTVVEPAPRPAAPAPPVAARDRRRAAEALGAVEERVKRLLGNPADGVWLVLALAPALLGLQFQAFSPWLLLPLPLVAAGAMFVQYDRAVYRARVRAALAASRLAADVLAGRLGLEPLRAATLPFARGALAAPVADDADGLRATLLTVAANAGWFLWPRSGYLPPRTQMLLAMLGALALALGGPFALLPLAPQGWAGLGPAAALPAKVLAGLPVLGPAAVGLVVVGLTGSFSLARAAIAAEEFLASLRRELED